MTYDDLPPEEPPYYDDDPRNLPHQNLDAERAVLGAILLAPETTDTLAHELSPGDFYLPKHETIWHAAHTLAADPDIKLDPLTLADHLARTGQLQRIGGAPYLHDLMAACPLPGNATHYAAQVRNAARLRAVTTTATKLHTVADKADPTNIDAALSEALQELDTAVARVGATSASRTGLRDLTWILTNTEPEQPTPAWTHRTDGHALFYAGKVNGVFGDPEAGKTWLAQTAIVEALNAGGTAAMIDVDHNGPNHTAARLLLLGARLEHLADDTRFRYYEPEDADELRAAVVELTRLHPDVVLIDSLGEVIPMLGLKSTDNDEISHALRSICQPPANHGSCVITIDHLPKSTEARATGYAIGGTAKKRVMRGSYLRAEARTQPAPGQIGRITLRIEKDTTGELRKSSGGGYAGTLVLDSTQPHITAWSIQREAAPVTEDGRFRPTHLMEKVSRFIEDHDQCTGRDIREAVHSAPKNVADAIRCLVDEGFVAVIDGPRNSKRHHSLMHYREDEDDTL